MLARQIVRGGERFIGSKIDPNKSGKRCRHASAIEILLLGERKYQKGPSERSRFYTRQTL